MAQQMFREVDHTAKTKVRYTMPLSIALWGILLGIIVVGPLLRATELPPLHHDVALMLATAKAPPLESTVQVRPTPKSPVPTPPLNPNTAPTESPHGFKPEPPPPPPFYHPGVVENPLPGPTAKFNPPPPPPPTPDRVHIGGDIRAPKKILDVRPLYPPVAMTARIEGLVIIQAVISKDGRVIEAKVLRSQPLLDQAALDAVEQWRFTPTLLNGQAVEVQMTVTVNFSLR